MSEQMIIDKLIDGETGKLVSNYAVEFQTDGTLVLDYMGTDEAVRTLTEYMEKHHPGEKYVLLKNVSYVPAEIWGGKAKQTVVFVRMGAEHDR